MRDLVERTLAPLLLATVLFAVTSCRPATEDEVFRVEEPKPEAAEEMFVDATAESGLDFVHWNGMSGELYFCEMVGSGAALLDYDEDGDLDLFLVQGSELGVQSPLFPAQHPLPLSDRLYRNDLDIAPDGTRRVQFIDVTVQSGLASLGTAAYGMGVASGDYDNDGRPDLYITSFGSNRLLHNEGPGVDGHVTFRDVTSETGTDDPQWSVSATFADIDRDGWLDLYVGNYVDYTLATHKRCRAATGASDYCGPLSYPPQTDRLLKNMGRGADGRVTFRDITNRAGIDTAFGGALGVVAADLDLDGWLDLYVANDGVANQMWINQGDGTFSDQALLGGSALNRDGHPEAGMGVDAGDYDNDGDEDLFLSHLNQESNTLYRNVGGARFEDATIKTGLGVPSWDATGFGTAFLDVDNDGWLDLLVLNGAVKIIEALARENDPHPLHLPNQLFKNLGDGRFEEMTAQGGAVWALSEVSRGAAVGDVDNDGDMDVVVANNGGSARLLLNQVGNRNHWLGLRLVGRDGRDMYGAWVEIVLSEEESRWRRVSTGGSYASARDPRILVGLGEAESVREVRVVWPAGASERFSVAAVDQYITLRLGAGMPLPAP